ncbi:MAG: hypothetical protein H6719_37285 [Sandaracinaceae bacterium]|nr:hypothetical protein [Sandaracinaceae bacterium]
MKPLRALAPLSLILGLAASASATVMIRASVEKLAAESELVVVGTVVEAEPQDGGPRGEGGIYTRVELSVDEVWRGATDGPVTFWVHGGRVGDRAMRTHGQATFEPGERVLVFLDDAGGALFPTNMSQGKWTLDGDSARSRAEAGALVTREGDRLTGAAPLAPMPLSELRARVRSVR